jgi:hypothetical protein
VVLGCSFCNLHYTVTAQSLPHVVDYDARELAGHLTRGDCDAKRAVDNQLTPGGRTGMTPDSRSSCFRYIDATRRPGRVAVKAIRTSNLTHINKPVPRFTAEDPCVILGKIRVREIVMPVLVDQTISDLKPRGPERRCNSTVNVGCLLNGMKADVSLQSCPMDGISKKDEIRCRGEVLAFCVL